MEKIRLLDSDTINAIAAGEVVERPSSVVKELVENAIDAGAGAVTVEIRGGGIEMIRVTDNGSGIDRDDIGNVFLRHATSKIDSVNDLLTIGTLGFRGEALSSIAAVAKVELITKVKHDIVGVRCLEEGGTERLVEDIGCPDGTTIIVRGLFYNTPARRKFLKTPVTEGGYISDLMDRLAMSRPDISFKFINNSQTKLHTSGNGRLKDVIYQIYGRDVTSHLLDIDYHSELLQITGYAGKPILSRGNRSWENYFINGRFIKSNIVTKAIEDAYKTFVMIHKFPFTSLHITIEPEMIDVNVHPRKMEIRFNQNEAVYDQVYKSVRDVLEHRELIPSASLGSNRDRRSSRADMSPSPEPFETRRIAHLNELAGAEKSIDTAQKPLVTEPEPEYRVSSVRRVTGSQAETSPQNNEDPQIYKGTQMDILPHNLLDKDAAGMYRLIGQVFDTYWMLEFDGKMYIMDQHAAHEKVLFERFRKDLEKKSVAVQQVTPPAVVTLSASEEDILNKYSPYFKELCFDIEPFGGKDYAIYGIPVYLFGMNIEDMFIEILDSLTQDSSNTEGNALTWKIASMACKAAVKGSRRISEAEARALIEELRECENPYNCPHGRPTIISVTRYELDKKFKRIQD